MQWSTPDTAFTTGRAWEAEQADSESVTVEQQQCDSGSLLAHYRRLIHLRDANDALGAGRLVPLQSNDSSVTAYLRREGTHVVLALVNVGSRSRTGVLVSSAVAAVPAGHWRLRSLLGGADASDLVVQGDGRLSHYAPLPSLAPERGYLFELSPTRTR